MAQEGQQQWMSLDIGKRSILIINNFLIRKESLQGL
jgi:hypothetical protein